MHTFCTLAAFLVCITALPVYGQAKEPEREEPIGFRPGKWYFDISGGSGFHFSNLPEYLIHDRIQVDLGFPKNFPLLHAHLLGYYTENFSTAEEKQLHGLLFWLNNNQHEMRSKIVQIQAEHGLTRYIGVTIGIHYEVYSIKHIRLTPRFVDDYLYLLYVSGGISGTLSSEVSIEQAKSLEQVLANTYVSKSVYYNVVTGNLGFSIHPFPEGRLDPFLKIEGGYGSESHSPYTVERVGGSIGLRYFLSDTFYMTIERGSHHSWIKASNKETAEIGQGSVKLGIGFGI